MKKHFIIGVAASLLAATAITASAAGFSKVNTITAILQTLLQNSGMLLLYSRLMSLVL